MDDKRYVLMSIKPRYAELIKSGHKTIELRRIAPKVKSGDMLVIYESSPVQRITSFCEIDEMIVTEPGKLWEIAKDTAGLTHDAFEKYFEGKIQAVGIRLGKLHLLNEPKVLSAISEDIQAPQSYRYITQKQFQVLVK